MKPCAKTINSWPLMICLMILLAVLGSCVTGCLPHKSVNATYATYGIGLQAPPTPVSPPFGLSIGYTKVTYHSEPTDTNKLYKAQADGAARPSLPETETGRRSATVPTKP